MEFSIKLGSNPEFTASVLVAYARAAYKYAQEGFTGAKTVLDIPFAYLSPKSSAELRKERSEERRVGKECRSRKTPCQYKRKHRNTEGAIQRREPGDRHSTRGGPGRAA